MKDIRKEPDFTPALFPMCDGKPFAIADTRRRLGQIRLSFLSAFYRTNLEYAKLVAHRKRKRVATWHTGERAILQAIEKAIRVREALDDRHAPRGIIAAPVYRNGFVVDVRFQYPGSPSSQPVVILSSASRFITFKLPRRPESSRNC